MILEDALKKSKLDSALLQVGDTFIRVDQRTPVYLYQVVLIDQHGTVTHSYHGSSFDMVVACLLAEGIAEDSSDWQPL